MLEELATAFERKDYHTATKLLKHLLEESPENPWVQFYLGRLDEVSGKHQEAQNVYRQLLRSTTNAKILSQARQGLQRLEEIEQEKRKQAIAQATMADGGNAIGVLVLEPISNEFKNQAAQKFAQIMQLDPYSAKLVLPTRGWRLYRSGAVGELKYYGEQLQNANISCFWVTLAEIHKIQVFQVNYFLESTPKASVVCRNQENQLGSLSFDWSEVKGRVLGLLPIFEQVIDRDVRGKLERKTKTQDYFQFYDLHLPGRGCILRLYDNGYDFQQGLEIASQSSLNTIKISWNSLVGWLEQQIPQVKVWSDFTPFAETILDKTEMLEQMQSHIHILRREQTNWDPAFHLYSGLVFRKNVS
ncbi:MAG: tetratricopeptide repeat protein [Stigonema ocellatum SAG 48.90 = DSM 106950]|nr:tetratricopeptide repeat protein [Stigonema ocellatum SAG 48.90 = DSM 106950]